MPDSPAPRRRSAGMTQPREMRRPDYIGSGPPRVNGDDLWALMVACVDGDLPTVKRLVAVDPTLCNANYWYETPMHYAVRENHLAVVKALLAAGADPACTPFCWRSWKDMLDDCAARGLDEMAAYLHRIMRQKFRFHVEFDATLGEAVRSRDTARIEAILTEQPHQIQHTDAYGNSAIHWAVLTYQPDLIPWLQRHYADIDMPRADGALAIHKAITRDYAYRDRNVPAECHRPAAEMVQTLIDAGARQPFGVLAWRGDIPAMQRWIAAEPTVATRLGENHVAPLTFAAMGGQMAAVELLLEAGADPTMPELLASRGRALFEAAARNDLAMAERLLDAGADPNAGVDSSGNAESICAHRNPDDHADMTALLRRRGATPPVWMLSRDELLAAYRAGRTPHTGEFMGLSYVMSQCDDELLAAMLDHDPDFPAQLHAWDFRSPSVKFQRYVSVIARLHETGLDINRGDWRAVTILHYAARFGNPELAAWLVDHGADLEAEELEHGVTPLGMAVIHDERAVAEVLLARGADPRAPADRPWAQAATLAAGKPELADLFA